MTIKYLKKANKTSSSDDHKTKGIVEKILKDLEKSKEDGCIELTKKFDKYEGEIIVSKEKIEEIKKKSISKLQICWIGDANNNVINSLIEASVKFSFKLNIGFPKKYEPNKTLLSWAKKNKGKIKIFNDSKKAATGSDVVFTDKVISMNDKVNKAKKLKEFKNFQVNSKVMSYAKKDAIFLHCLPRGSEVSNDVFLGKQSKVWQQALNRVYVQKSILLYCFDKLR